MKNLITLLVFSTFALILAFRFPQSNNELKWLDWNEAYTLSKKNNKPLLIDAYTDWCGWCKRMDHDTYTQSEVINLIDKNFVPVKFNPELKNKVYKVGEKELNGQQLLYSLTQGQNIGYPTTFFLSLEKNEVTNVQGYKTPEQMVALLKEKTEWASKK